MYFNALGDYTAHVLGFNVTKIGRRCLVNQRYTLLAFLSAEIAELGVEDGDPAVAESVNLYGLRS